MKDKTYIILILTLTVISLININSIMNLNKAIMNLSKAINNINQTDKLQTEMIAKIRLKQ